MFDILKMTIKTGVVTTKYPEKEDHVSEGFRGRPQILPEKCTLCGACAEACPSGALWLEKNGCEMTLTLSYCGCIFCGRCEEVCPNQAIKLTREFEMASKTKDDLVTIIRRRS
ncbi:MAG: 4Fe-4S binding protein [Methanosarcinaceae archaeon]|nr:4Fe-4S binding protein [Methanosarcinaceae archaeon]